MMQTKLIKLAKRLKIFTFEEFLIMSGEEEKNVKIFLDELLAMEMLEKNRQNSYKYNEFISVPQVKELKIKRMFGTYFSKEEIKILEDEKNTLESYKNAPEHIKKMIDKYLAVLKVSNNHRGRVLDNFIRNEWNKNNPDMQTSRSAFSRAKRLLKNYGIAGLISPCLNFIITDKRIDEEVYKDFRNYILENKGKSIKYNYTKFRAEYLRKNPDVADHEYAGYWSFVNRIRKDVLKFKDSELAEIYEEKKIVRIKKKKYGFKTFKSAADDYLKDIIEKNEVGICVIRQNKRNINKYLIPYFKTIKLKEINEDKLEKYKIFLQEQQISSVIIREQLNLIQKILNIYSYDLCTCAETKRINSEFINKSNILEEEQIINLLNTCKEDFPEFYPLLLTSVNTGLTRGEVLVLTWDKFDHKNKKLKIDKSIYNGKIIKFRQKHVLRTVDLPDILIEILLDLKKSKNPEITDYIFPGNKGNFQNPDTMINEKFLPLINKAGLENIKFIDLRDSYTVFLIKQNLPLTYIRDQLGIHSIKELTDKYYKFIPKITRKNLCLI